MSSSAFGLHRGKPHREKVMNTHIGDRVISKPADQFVGLSLIIGIFKPNNVPLLDGAGGWIEASLRAARVHSTRQRGVIGCVFGIRNVTAEWRRGYG
jgi:hypothetical protein